jgi:hypothetical protein
MPHGRLQKGNGVTGLQPPPPYNSSMSLKPYDHPHPARHHRRWGRAALLAPLLIIVCLVAAACGGGTTPATGVASVGKSTATTDPPSGGGGNSGSPSSSSKYADGLKYSECMRSHGVPNFPDPGSNGAIQIQGGPNSSNGLNPNSAQFQAASKTCQHLLPNGGKITPAQQQQMLSQALKFSECMRSHGVPNFPDPTTSGGGVGIKIGGPGSGIDPNSPQFQAAQKACGSLLPGRPTSGGPGGGSGVKTAIVG